MRRCAGARGRSESDIGPVDARGRVVATEAVAEVRLLRSRQLCRRRVGGARMAVLLLVTLGTAVVVSTAATPVGRRHRLGPDPGLRLGRRLDGQRLHPGHARGSAPNLVTSLNDGSVFLRRRPCIPATRAPTTPPAARSTPDGQLLRHRRLQRPDQRVRPRRHTDRGLRLRACQNPLSLVFDNQGNLYVGQQTTPYIAEFNSSGQSTAQHRTRDHGRDGRRLDRPLQRPVHLLLHDRDERHLPLQQVHQHPGSVELQRGPLHRSQRLPGADPPRR